MSVFTVDLANQPGELARLCEAMAGRGINLVLSAIAREDGGTVAFIQFTGHGVKGTIDALSKFTDSSVSIAGLGHKNVTTISIRPK